MNPSHRSRKRFGQHFLMDPSTIERVLTEIHPDDTQTIVEIGPGHGAISEPLARLAGTLHAIEIDRNLADSLVIMFAGYRNVIIHQADVLVFDLEKLGKDLRIAGNLPYNISTPLLFRLVEFRHAIRDMHFMLQKEVVDRMAATPGNKTYGRLSIMLGCYMDVEPLFDVPASAFCPQPKVMSSFVRLRPVEDTTYAISDHRLLAAIVAQAFSQRRKTLRNALKSRITEQQLIDAGMDPNDRPECASIENYVALANQLAAR